MAKRIYLLEWKTLKVWESFVVKSEETGAEKSEPGTVVKTDKKEFTWLAVRMFWYFHRYS